ncbi:hypothetical protein BO94DRAFT_319817 [Aspergillus sclerotioniger CBS 115572]|uniref:Secreted protein n=1 Tax=Aspergillus sclerotioniger CBS 115572 TaxID=1450535 RepID=A0A317XC42_9EURO|nr:hypothetical protein BO94DRAFT_319817 [Aspergillus sclerotioniger CBS 115572]PWY94110.1 hypothetical protein BO94DRAFT_319817 [Aspergillus sclerotioniger CBS 115572]
MWLLLLLPFPSWLSSMSIISPMVRCDGSPHSISSASTDFSAVVWLRGINGPAREPLAANQRCTWPFHTHHPVQFYRHGPEPEGKLYQNLRMPPSTCRVRSLPI